MASMKEANFIRLHGREVYFEQYKTEDSPTPFCFLLVHGFLACTYSFHRLIPYLSQKYDTYAIDLIGFGNSEKPSDFDYSYRSYALIVHEFINEMGLKNVILMGHSMGGQICLYTAQQAPSRVHSLVLVNCSGYIGTTETTLKYLSHVPLFQYLIKWWLHRVDLKEIRKKAAKILKSTVYDENIITEEMIQIYSRPVKDKSFSNTIVGLLRNREGDMSSKDLGSIPHPVLLIWGEEDHIVPVKLGVRLRMDLPTSKLIVIPRVGHQVIEEIPYLVYEEIEQWLIEISCDK
ncbi:MAG TPA: alpha/beta hydrolase, partial [Bacillota bacterium]|nr:alpha/beta hydrolase [Bacillota bacterium]